MKFSIVIPTSNRPDLLALSVGAALASRNVDMHVVVSDNSTTREFADENLARLKRFVDDGAVTYIRAPKFLSPPEHFEFALRYASGDAVAYLTDKMIIRPHTLSHAERVFEATGAQIVNWNYRIFDYDRTIHNHLEAIQDFSSPDSEVQFVTYKPFWALWVKSFVLPDRTKQDNREMARGKIVYGAYRGELIDEILGFSGTLFGGATHDYSAMIQALIVAKLGAEIKEVGIDFAGLAPEESLGSATASSASAALDYFRSFQSPELITANLMVPGLFASQHNMVAHDYLKFLKLYGAVRMFNRREWLDAIAGDLSKAGRVWADDAQREAQLGLLREFLAMESARPSGWLGRLVYPRMALAKLWLRQNLGIG